MSTTRKKRWKPDRKQTPAGFRVTLRDVEMLKLLARYRYLRTSYLCAMMGTTYYTRKRLAQLHTAGIVNKRTDETREQRGNFYLEDVYALPDDLHTRLPSTLAKYIKEVEEVTNLLRRPKSPGRNYVHSMMICDTLASIELGARQHGLAFITQSEITNTAPADDPLRLPCHIRLRDRDGRMQRKDDYLRPDGLFGLRYPDGMASFFLLEAEHYSPIDVEGLDRSSLKKKVHGYHDIIKNKRYHQLSHKPLPNLRVLFVLPTFEMMNNRLAYTKEHFPNTNMFLFDVAPIPEEELFTPKPFPEIITRGWLTPSGKTVYLNK